MYRFGLIALAFGVATRLPAQTAAWARPHIFAGVEAGHDDQPITYVRPSIAAWTYLTDWTTVGAKVSTTAFRLSDTASRTLTVASATASQSLWNGRVSLDAELGAVARSWGASSDGIANARVVAQIAPGATITGRVEHFAYTYTEQSLTTAVMPTRYTAELALSSRTGWMGQAGFQDARFGSFGFVPTGDNDVTSGYVWALAPVPGVGRETLQLGYSFSAATSTRLMYGLARPVQAVPPSSANFDLSGVYSPYYTPRDQRIHSALASLTLGHGGVTLHANGAFGFYATESAPQITSATVTPRGAAPAVSELERSFNPWNVHATLTSAVSRHASLVAAAELTRTAFYTAQSATLSLDYTIGK
jgi:hypothetical protein